MDYIKQMKIVGILALLMGSTNAFAESADYVCSVNQYRVDLILTDVATSSSFWLTDDSGRVLSLGYALFVENAGEETLYHFYPQAGETILTFDTADVTSQPESLYGTIQTTADGFPLYDRLSCIKQ